MSHRALLHSLVGGRTGPGKRSSNQCQAAGGALHNHYGRVTGVNSSGRVDVSIDGGPSTPNLAHPSDISPNIGDYCAVQHENDTFIVAHVIVS